MLTIFPAWPRHLCLSGMSHRTCIWVPVLLVTPTSHSLGLRGGGIYILKAPFELLTIGSAWLRMERREQAAVEERSCAYSAAHSTSSGGGEGKEDAGVGGAVT